jgi:hypothetical protein
MILLYPLLENSTCIELISRSKNPVTQSLNVIMCMQVIYLDWLWNMLQTLKPWTVSKILDLRNNQNSVHKITD